MGDKCVINELSWFVSSRFITDLPIKSNDGLFVTIRVCMAGIYLRFKDTPWSILTWRWVP